MNNVVLIGRLTRDPELRYIPNSGKAVCNFTLAVDKGLSKDKKADMEARNQATADFPRITVWGKLAENCANYLAKGRLVAIQGRLQTGYYDDKDGKRVYTTDVIAHSVKFLEWGDNNSNQVNDDNQFEDIDGFNAIDNDDIPF